MTDINTITVTGRLTADPKIEQTKGATSVARFSIASNYYRKGVENTVSFFDCVVFGNGTQVIENHFTKGTPVLISGELRQDPWEKDGQKKSRVYIMVDQFRMMGSKKEGGAPAAAAPASTPPAADDAVPF